MTNEKKEQLKNIKAFVFDVDGVFTDATLIIGDHDVMRVYNVKDGYGVNVALRLGYQMAIISGGKQESIRDRLGGLGIQDIFLSVGTDKKLSTFDNYLEKYKLKANEVVYIGDDMPDIEIMQKRDVFSASPADAIAEVKKTADYNCKLNGGKGCVRELIELVLIAKGEWMTIL